MHDASALLELFRVEVDDALVPGGVGPGSDDDNLWKQAEVERYFAEAQEELARRTYALVGNIPLPVSGNEAEVSRPAHLYLLRSARLDDRPLCVRNMNEMGMLSGTDYGAHAVTRSWETLGGPTSVLVKDYAPGVFRLFPIPERDGELVINGVLLPEDPCALAFRTLREQRALLTWMKHLAYAKQDADAMDLSRSEAFGAQFDALADELKSDNRRGTRRVGTVRYGGL